MHNQLFIKYIPFIFFFTFIFQLTFFFFKNQIDTRSLADTNYIKQYPNVHKGFELSYTSSFINKVYSKKFTKLAFKKSNLNYTINQEKFFLPSRTKEKKYISIFNYKTKLPQNKIAFKNTLSKNKQDFINTLLPIIAFQNQKILAERKHLLEIKDYLNINKTLTKKDIIFLDKIAKKYQINSIYKHKIDLLNDLLISVDIIPNSIVLAQAANESGWGTSRFAKEYNALFGQYTYDENNGILPAEREEGEKHFVKFFSSFDQSVESYFKNINTHYAYSEFRKLRKNINNIFNSITINLLVQELDVYAKDANYVNILKSIIHSNQLTQFDNKKIFFIKS